MNSRGITLALCLIAVLSGAAALVFETLWFRQVGLGFGNSVWASSIVLASFMAGLALGNGLAGRLGSRILRPIRCYALLELAVGTGGLLLVFTLPALGVALVPLFQPLQDSLWAVNALRLLVCFSAMLLPAIAMGATLPVLVRALFAADPHFGRVLGRLYGWNTIGAVAGAVLSEALLIGWLGVRGAGVAAAALNLGAALSALVLARRFELAVPASPSSAQGNRRLSRAAIRVLAAAFFSGAIFLALEVVWFRFLSLFVYGTSLAFALLLAVALAGISLGGLAASCWPRDPIRSRGLVPQVALLAGVFVLLCYEGFDWVSRSLYSDVLAGGGMIAAAFAPDILLLAVSLMFPVSFLSGALFTLLGAAAMQEVGLEVRAAGYLTLANTSGAALGSLLAGFVLLPGLGMERSFLVLALLYVVVSLLAWPESIALRARGTRIALVATVIALGVATLTFPFGRMETRYLPNPTRPFAQAGNQLVAVREGLIETIAFVRTDRLGRPLYHRMFTNGFSMSATNMHSRRYMKAYVYLPVAIHPQPRDALLISYGVGSTAKALTDTASLRSIDIVDISRDILEMSSIIFPDARSHPLNDPRVKVHIEDGRYFLQTTDKSYDLITSEPPPPKNAGIVNLYSREYFQLMRRRLAEGGVVSYWLPVHSLRESDALTILRGFCDVFEDCTLWSGAGLDWMMLGTKNAKRPGGADQFQSQWRDPKTASELRAVGLETPGQLGATFLAGAAAIRDWTRAVEPLVDDFPHRLSSDPMLPGTSPRSEFYRSVMDPAEAVARFSASDFVRRLWPASERQDAIDAFAFQRIVNARLTYDGRFSSLVTQEDLHRVLTETDFETLALWILGSDSDEQAIVSALPARARARPEVLMLRAIGALARREYASAARLFGELRERKPSAARARGLEIYALCLAGKLDMAGQRADEFVRSAPELTDDDAYWRFLDETFGLSDPRAPDPAPAALWSQPPALPVPLSNNAVAAISGPEGTQFYSFLGLDAGRSAEGITRRAFRWRRGEPHWTELPAVPGPPRLAATAQAVGNRVYVFGGYSVAPDGAERSLPIVAVWDSDAESWSQAADIPLPVDDAVSGLSSNGRVYLVSGWHDRDNVSAVQVYDPAADRWAQATPIPGVPVFGHAGAVSDRSIVYIGGVRRRALPRGFEIERSAWHGEIDERDPLRIRWERLPDPPGPPRYRAAAGVLGALFVFAGGTDRPYNYDGVGYDGQIAKPLAEVVAYDSISRRWGRLPSLPDASMDHRGLAVADGRACLVGGMQAGPRVTTAVRCLTLPKIGISRRPTGTPGRPLDFEPHGSSRRTSAEWRPQASAATLSVAEPKERR